MKRTCSALLKNEMVRTSLAAAVFCLLIGVATFFSKGNLSRHALGAAFLPGQEGDSPSEQDSLAFADQAWSARAHMNLKKLEPLPPQAITSETLWLARCIYSETKRPREQELVAWVVRNRVETGYRGNDSYREAVLDPYQFSAFNPGSRKRAHYASLDTSSQARGWQLALRIAHHVKGAPNARRPFSKATRHFFSERSMTNGRHPNWALRGTKVTPQRYSINEDRFRFYEDVM